MNYLISQAEASRLIIAVRSGRRKSQTLWDNVLNDQCKEVLSTLWVDAQFRILTHWSPSYRPGVTGPPSTMYRLVAICLSLVTPCMAPPPPETTRHTFETIESISYENFDLDNYDPRLHNYGYSVDLNNYEDMYYSEPEPEIEVATLAPKHKNTKLPTTQEPKITTTTSIATKPAEPDIFGSLTEQGLPTCLVCVCLGTSVYCDDADLTILPPLPKDTTYLYARFNKISHVRSKSLAELDKLKYVDLSSNYLSEIDYDAFHLLPSLQELILSENQLRHLPKLPSSLVRLNVQNNQLQSSGIRTESFKDLTHLQFLYLSNNKLDNIPIPLPASLRSLHLQNNNIQTLQEDTFCSSQDLTFIRRALEDIRLDANPINLSTFANDFFCLPRLPTGPYF
ncbi:opticin-like isoform X1 [Eleutherodactylus coqui]|uniref:opticin-like isoform X1 n=1 Tax=Eleutherodactylus coqui TaxID=57060 RepID=UPI0034632083